MAVGASKVATNGWLGRAQTLRIGGVLGFIVVMPILAIPAVNQRIDAWFFSSSSNRLSERLARVRQLPVDSTPEEAVGDPSAAEEWPAGRPVARLATEGVSRLPPVESGISPAAFDALQARLQELGASYYRLEDRREAGESTPQYRFRCEVPLPGNENYLRPFEADDRDPMRAIQAVVAEIEAWLARHRLAPVQWESPSTSAPPAEPQGGKAASGVAR